MAETTFDADAIRSAGTRMQNFFDVDATAFHNLQDHWPNAGGFATAQWLERLVDDRRNAIVRHGQRLETLLETLGTELISIADELERRDGENADEILSSLDGIWTEIATEVGESEAMVEDEQGNFTSGGEDDDEENAGDGDGYDDILPGGEDSSDDDSDEDEDEDDEEDDEEEEDDEDEEDEDEGADSDQD